MDNDMLELYLFAECEEIQRKEKEDRTKEEKQRLYNNPFYKREKEEE